MPELEKLFPAPARPHPHSLVLRHQKACQEGHGILIFGAVLRVERTVVVLKSDSPAIFGCFPARQTAKNPAESLGLKEKGGLKLLYAGRVVTGLPIVRQRCKSKMFPGVSVNFKIKNLPIQQFTHLFGLSEQQLALYGVERHIANANPGFPCRVSLRDADVGESVLLFNYEHHKAQSPYRASGAIYVRESAEDRQLDVNVVPEILRRRLLSIRAYDKDGVMLDADIVEGIGLEPVIAGMFANNEVEYLHVHNAKPGCFAACVVRA
jgi:hypothetical protein